MKHLPALLFLALCATWTPLHAQAPTRPTQIELSHEHNHLNNDSPSWKETGLRMSHSFSKERLVNVAVTSHRRFGLSDRQVSTTYVMPVAHKLLASLDASLSDTHRVLAKRSLGGTAQYEFAPAWLASVGIRNTRYNAVSVNQGSLGLEHYFSSFGVAATWFPVRAYGTTVHSGSLRGSYYYGDKNSIGLILAVGEEITPIGAGNVVMADIRAAALVGRHWISPEWAVNYALGSTSQGSFYTRNGVRIGAQYAF